MNSLLALGTIVVACGLAACAPQPLTKSDVDGRIVCNTDRMDQVERDALHRNAQLRWVHCPEVTLRAS